MKILCLLLTLAPGLLMANEAVTYACDNGLTIRAQFAQNSDGRPLVSLDLNNQRKALALIPAASGAHYRGDGLNFYTKGEDAILENPDGTIHRCTVGNTPPPPVQPQPPAISSFVDIGGSVSYRQRIALPPDAVLTIKVQDTSRAGGKALTLAEQRIELNGQQVPIAFNLVVDRDLLSHKKARIALSARIDHQGKLLFISDKAIPVTLVDGKSHSDVMLRQPVVRRGR